MLEELRKTGIEIIGDIPWSTHLCQFYQSQEDLLDILVPYFKAGLENNEFCIWITSDPLSELEARQALENQVPGVIKYFERGQIEILSHSKWYLGSGSFDMQKVLDAWVEKLDQGLARGFEGLRATGNATWLEKKQWSEFAEYEKAINRVLAHRKVLAICTYGLDKCNALEIIDVVRNHEYALVKQGKHWELIENSVHKQAKEELKISEERFRGIFENSAIGIEMFDEAGKFITANEASLEIFGASDLSKFKEYHLFDDPNIPPNIKERLLKAESVGYEAPFDFEQVKEHKLFETAKSGSVYLDMLVTSLKKDEKSQLSGFLLQVQDVTERKKIEEYAAQSKEELELRVKQRTIELEKLNLALNSEILQHRQAEERSLIIAASFRNVISNCADGILIVNKTGVIRLANPAAEKLLGCRASELINTPFTHMLSADKQSEIEIILHNSEIHAADMSVVETQWEGEACYLVTLRDVTQSKKDREALRHNKSQLENLINALSEGVTLIDVKGRVIKANPAMCHIIGKELSDIEGNLYYNLGNRVFKLDYTTLRKEDMPVSIVLNTRQGVFNFEIGLERNDGSMVWLRENAVPLMDGSGTLEGVVRTFHDITEQKRMEASLRKNEAHLRLMLDQMPCILWTTDNQLIITLSLGAGLQTFNLCSNQIVAMSLYDYFNTSDPDFYPILAHRQALAGQATSYELHWEGKILNCYVEPLKDSTNTLIGVIGIGFDVTGKKQAEEALRALSRRLVDVQENERRNIARELHDEIGQSLAALKLMMTQVTRSGSDFCPSSLMEAQTVVTELIRQVRDMSLRLRPSMLDDLGLLPTLLWHIERYELQTNIKVILEHSGLLRSFSPEINTAIYRIVQEALTNVARHANAKEVNITIWADDSNITLKIEDHGRGFTSSALYSSSSTGISGMRERVLLLGGKLNIETIPGSGTYLEAEIPLN